MLFSPFASRERKRIHVQSAFCSKVTLFVPIELKMAALLHTSFCHIGQNWFLPMCGNDPARLLEVSYIPNEDEKRWNFYSISLLLIISLLLCVLDHVDKRKECFEMDKISLKN